MRFIDIDALPLLARSEAALRSVARRLALGARQPEADLILRARSIEVPETPIGRVVSAGTWFDPTAHQCLLAALGTPLADALRASFEWYVCRGAFFHNDAHYASVMFGVWYIDGPPVDIVFPRAGLRISSSPGTVIVFDPFEVHGVLRVGATEYVADDYFGTERSVLAGFELEIDAAVKARFGIEYPAANARVISSASRVSAATGALE